MARLAQEEARSLTPICCFRPSEPDFYHHLRNILSIIYCIRVS